MPYENWGKITFQDWTFYIQFWEYPHTGKVGSRELFFCHFCPPPLLPHLLFDEDCLKKVNSTGLQRGLDSLVQLYECMWVQEKVHGDV